MGIRRRQLVIASKNIFTKCRSLSKIADNNHRCWKQTETRANRTGCEMCAINVDFFSLLMRTVRIATAQDTPKLFSENLEVNSFFSFLRRASFLAENVNCTLNAGAIGNYKANETIKSALANDKCYLPLPPSVPPAHSKTTTAAANSCA